jgi:hypothetical protein
MNSHPSSSRKPSGRATIALAAALALVAMLFSYLGGAVAGAAPAAQGSPTAAPEGTPVAQEASLPAEAAAALEAYLAANGDAGLAAEESQLPASLSNSFTYMHLAQLLNSPGTGQGPITPTPVTPTPEPEPDAADVSVRLWSDPSIRVIRGGTFTYEIRVRNHGDGSADQIKVTLPYRRDQYTLLEGKFDGRKGDWVSNIGDKTITVTFGGLAPNTERTGRLIFRAASNLANDTVLDIRATYGWDDDADGADDRKSNWQPLLVGAGNASAPWVWTAIGPTSGPASTVFRVDSNRFIPGETVVTWLNLPGGKVKALDLRGTANALGAVELYFQDSKLPAGNYQIVLYGQRSGLTGVASFSIR